jgi:hypothetical protein
MGTIFHKSGNHACNRRMPNKGEKLIKVLARVRTDNYREVIVVSATRRDRICQCYITDSNFFSSTVQPRNLQWYDKYLK